MGTQHQPPERETRLKPFFGRLSIDRSCLSSPILLQVLRSAWWRSTTSVTPPLRSTSSPSPRCQTLHPHFRLSQNHLEPGRQRWPSKALPQPCQPRSTTLRKTRDYAGTPSFSLRHPRANQRRGALGGLHQASLSQPGSLAPNCQAYVQAVEVSSLRLLVGWYNWRDVRTSWCWWYRTGPAPAASSNFPGWKSHWALGYHLA